MSNAHSEGFSGVKSMAWVWNALHRLLEEVIQWGGGGVMLLMILGLSIICSNCSLQLKCKADNG